MPSIPKGQLTNKLKTLHPQPGDTIPSIPPLPDDSSPTLHSNQPRQRSTNNPPPLNRNHAPTTFPFKEYQTAIFLADTGSAPGPCGTTYRHMRVWFSKEDTLGSLLTQSFNHLTANSLDPISNQLLNAARVVAVPKDQPGEILPRGLVFNRLVHTKGLKAEFGFESRRGKLQVSSMFACH